MSSPRSRSRVAPASSSAWGESSRSTTSQCIRFFTVFGSLQCPFYVSRALETLFGLPRSRVRVVQTTTGGGFGGKEEYPSVIGLHAALLALKAHRPVRMIYDRHEDLAATTKRHPAIVRHRTGVTRDGRLIAAKSLSASPMSGVWNQWPIPIARIHTGMAATSGLDSAT